MTSAARLGATMSQISRPASACAHSLRLRLAMARRARTRKRRAPRYTYRSCSRSLGRTASHSSSWPRRTASRRCRKRRSASASLSRWAK
eukprot:13479415-Alexandrium_andersonii.AAC.1